ncbi:MAG: hypothetical protein Q8N85_05770 [Candidatus Omnitrophota bacterium]|nr:hypothetical protein [Candidatus Omnitrophota bacterium]
MANPLPNEKEVYEKIEKEKLTIPSPIWELLTHHLGNDLHAITLIAGSHVTGEDKEAIPPEDGRKIVKHVEEVKEFMDKLARSIGRE